MCVIDISNIFHIFLFLFHNMSLNWSFSYKKWGEKIEFKEDISNLAHVLKVP